MNERPAQIRADQWDTIAGDVRAGRCVAYYDGHQITDLLKRSSPMPYPYFFVYRDDDFDNLMADDIITLEWHDDLAAMAADPDIQREMAYIAAEFAQTDMDGLYSDDNRLHIASAGLLSEARASVALDGVTHSDPAADRIARLEAHWLEVSDILHACEVVGADLAQGNEAAIDEGAELLPVMAARERRLQAELDAAAKSIAACSFENERLRADLKAECDKVAALFEYLRCAKRMADCYAYEPIDEDKVKYANDATEVFGNISDLIIEALKKVK